MSLLGKSRSDCAHHGVATRRGAVLLDVRGLNLDNCRSAARLLCFAFWLSFLTRHLLPTNLAELFAADNRLDGGANAVLVRFQLVAHLGNERAVREEHPAAQRIAEQLP